MLLNTAFKMFLSTYAKHELVPQAKIGWIVDVVVAAGTAFSSL